MSIDELDTPALLVDQEILNVNLRRAQDWATERACALWPHIKTHKSAHIARLQASLGACGHTCATLREAEMLAEAGFSEITIAYPLITAAKMVRLKALAQRLGSGLRVVLDSRAGADVLAALKLEVPLAVLIEVDTGMHRCGVGGFEQALDLAAHVGRQNGLRLHGVLTHAGHAHDASGPAQIQQIAQEEARQLDEVVWALRQAGFAVGVVSAGSTLTARFLPRSSTVNEIRPGTYVYNDLRTAELGLCRTEDLALSVLCTVVSVNGDGRVVVDAGAKSLSAVRSSAYGYGLSRDGGLQLTSLSEEHGMGRTLDGASYAVGDLVEVWPVHVCTAVSLHREVFVRRGRNILGSFTVDAAGH